MRIGVTGHQQIPLEAIPLIQARLDEALDEAEADGEVTGVTSLAAGADQLFAAAVLARGGRLHVVLPSARYEASFAAAEDLARFRTFLQKAASVETLGYPVPSDAAYLAAGRQVVNTADVLLAVWDGQPARGDGGTGDIVSYARSRHVPVTVIWPDGMRR